MIARKDWIVAGLLAAGLGLGACDNGQSAVETRDRAESAEDAAAPAAATVVEAPPAPSVEKARWTSNRQNTTDQNIQRLYERNGAAFGAATAEAYVAHAHAFIANPPAGTETVRRANGDTLYYQASSNTFLVANLDGVPRTMFKPDNGAAYWEQQKAREAARGG